MTAAALAAMLAVAAADAVIQDVRLAVVAGNNQGLEGEQPLEFAESDAVRFHGVLTQLGGVTPRRAHLVLGGGPEDVLGALAEMTRQARELAPYVPTTVILYVSAHADEDALHLGGQRLPLAELMQRLRGAPAHLRIAVVDACRLPFAARQKGGHPGPEVPVVLDQSARVDGEVVLTSAGPGELAQEWSHIRGSLFTHHLLVGLRGAADLDGNGRVSLTEAYAYAYRATLARAAEAGLVPQRPSFDFRLAGFGDWIVTSVGTGGAELVLAEPFSGRVRVTDRRSSDVIAEIEKHAGEPMRLTLAPGLYRVVRLTGRWAGAADLDLALGETRRIDEGDLVRLRPERALAKGGPPIVLRPWKVVGGWGLTTPAGPGMPARQSLELGADYAFGNWSARLLLGGGWDSVPASGATISERELHLAASLAWTFPVSVAIAGMGLELQPRVVWQRLGRPPEVERVFGPGRVQTSLGLAAGPLVSASVVLRERATFGLDLGAGVEWAPDQQGKARARGYAETRILASWMF